MLVPEPARAAPADIHDSSPTEHGRWPTWPTEVDETAAPLRDPSPKASQERDRENALRNLEAFATTLITADVVGALEDPSPQVRREALRICYERRIRACTPGAVTLWNNDVDPSQRTAALKVLAVDPDPAHVVILLSALRESNDQIRADAARFVGWAALTPAGRRDARAALVAKLNDISALVRQRAVQSLGILGLGDATLAVARLLDDPEPSVRSAVAEALARGRDARAAPALIRAIDGMNEPMVTKAMLEALAQLPGPHVADELLARFDDPPAGLTSRQIADAIGNRPDPEPQLVEGLVARLREHALRPAALGALLVMGEAATDALRDAERRGLSPAVAIEVRRLLAATEVTRETDVSDGETSTPVWPEQGDHPGWLAAMRRGPERTRMDAAQQLAASSPAWMDGAIAAELRTFGPLASRRPWVLALVLAARPVELDVASWTRLEGWALDIRLAPSDRCLAAAALGAATKRTDRRRLRIPLLELIDDASPVVRACVVFPLARIDGNAASRIEPLLLDEAPRVRASAALALATLELPRATRARLALLHARDTSAEVRAAANVALREPRLDARPTHLTRDEPEAAWSMLPRWLPVELAGGRVWVPLLGSGRHRWALAPGLPKSTVSMRRSEPAPVDDL